jgi:hypothetical protein
MSISSPIVARYPPTSRRAFFVKIPNAPDITARAWTGIEKLYSRKKLSRNPTSGPGLTY